MSSQEEASVDDGIAKVTIEGPLEHHGGWWFDSYDSILGRIERALEDQNTKALVLCIDSPGGEAAGMVEAHRKIKALRAKYDKPVFAFANECAASAAYGIASAADELWLPETGHVGSVGVIACVFDRTKANEKWGINVRLITTGERKGDGHPDKPLDSKVIAALQEQVDTIGKSFFEIVGSARGMSPSDVEDLEAGVFYGASAIDAGLADRIGSYDELMAYVRETVRLAGEDEGASPTRSKPKETSDMLTRAQALKAVNDAKTALLAAKTEEERKKFLAQHEAAVKALAKCEEDAEDEDKEKAEDEESDDDSEDKDAEDEESEDDDAEEEDDDGDKDADDDSDAEDEDDKKEAKALSAKDARRLFAACRELTGKSNVREVLGALSAMGSKLAGAEKLRERVTRLESENKRATVGGMLAKAKKEGRITPAEARELEKQGLKDPKWLKGYLATLDKKRVRTTDEGGLEGAGSVGGSAFGRLSADQQKMVETSARTQGRDKEELAKELLAKINPNGAAARH